MSIIISRRKASNTPVAGTFTCVIPHSSYGYLVQMYISPETQSTTYDVQILDSDSNVIHEETDLMGRWNVTDKRIPVSTNVSIVVSNSSVNELFTILFVFET